MIKSNKGTKSKTKKQTDYKKMVKQSPRIIQKMGFRLNSLISANQKSKNYSKSCNVSV